MNNLRFCSSMVALHITGSWLLSEATVCLLRTEDGTDHRVANQACVCWEPRQVRTTGLETPCAKTVKCGSTVGDGWTETNLFVVVRRLEGSVHQWESVPVGEHFYCYEKLCQCGDLSLPRHLASPQQNQHCLALLREQLLSSFVWTQIMVVWQCSHL